MFHRTSPRFLTFSLLVWFVCGLLVGFLEVALNPEVYDRIQQEINVYDSVGMNQESLSRVNVLLVEYLTDKTDNLTTEEEVFGIRQQVFNEREIMHMVDVKNLFQLVQILQKIIGVTGIVLLTMIMDKMYQTSWKRFVRPFLKAFKQFFIILICVFLVGCVIFWMVGFERLFIGFHHLFFTNDLWLMNPLTDTMIRMFPGEFFERIVGEIVRNMALQSFITPLSVTLFIFTICFFARLMDRTFRRKGEHS